MITFFTTPEPFRGHIDVIESNAIESWKRIHPSVEVIPFGDEEGADGQWPATWPILVASSRFGAIVVNGGLAYYQAVESEIADVV